MFKREELTELSNIDHRVKYINHLIGMILGNYQPTEIEREMLKGYAAEYSRSFPGRASVRCLARVLAEVKKLVSGKDKESGLLKV